MKHDNEFLKVLYESNSLEDFIEMVDPSEVADSRTRAIIAALKRSVQVLELEFNPISLKEPDKDLKSQETQGQ